MALWLGSEWSTDGRQCFFAWWGAGIAGPDEGIEQFSAYNNIRPQISAYWWHSHLYKTKRVGLWLQCFILKSNLSGRYPILLLSDNTSCSLVEDVKLNSYRELILPPLLSGEDPCRRIIWHRTACTCPCSTCCRLVKYYSILHWVSNGKHISWMAMCTWLARMRVFLQNSQECLWPSCWG